MSRSEHHQEGRGRRHMIESPAKSENLEEKIRLRAYELYEQRNGVPGDPESDWYRAEAEIVPPKTEHEH